ncbi:hypothetical protein P3T36_000408 [Kitasatospora sp. MAP12-15]|uniref:hypothetical protein n=1 Tax=unclassified Kitasatospora TaxID=2633591 RepID=UPI0024746F15|nr:hypothetical protein [Kitasatospora sp. MAP12-44]MDH6109637.1 hypothetical protein [Kitasatospora sp. MAP12-44]
MSDAVSPSSSAAASRERWRLVRAHLNRNRFTLTRQVLDALAPERLAPGTPMLARPHWVPEAPVPLERVRLRWRPDAAPAVIDGGERELDGTRALREDGTPYVYYADAVRELAPPRLFEGRSCYRLLEVGTDRAEPVLTFGPGQYFDMINVGEAAAHEYAAAALAGGGTVDERATPFRAAVADPTDLARRPVMAATITLTIRHDRAAGTAEFLLHWRDPAKVASGGGLCQVIPAGMFQSSYDAPWNEAHDFDLWRAILRELSEELLGGSEDYGSDLAPIDYQAWPLHQALGAAREQGTLRLYWLGVGMDPLTYAADLLTVAVFDAELFDETFRDLTAANEEGHRIGAGADSLGIPFTAEQIDRLTDASSATDRMQPVGAALLRLAWRHREALLA